MAGNDEFRDREQAYPDTMGALIASFGRNVVQAHHELQVTNAQYIQTLAAMESINWAVEVGILTLNQGLTLLGKIPIFSVVDTDPFVFTEATLDLEMRVSAHREDSSQMKAQASTEASFTIGGIAKIFGGGGSIKVKADTSYQRDTRRTSDYSSTVKAHIKMERVEAPEGVQLIRDTTNEVVRTAMKINQAIVERQAEKLTEESQQTEVPETLPVDPISGDGGGESTVASDKKQWISIALLNQSLDAQ